MPKPEWGAKHSCSSCGTKFYDFNKSRKAASIRRIEATSYIGASGMYIWMTSYIPPMGRPDLVVLLAGVQLVRRRQA